MKCRYIKQPDEPRDGRERWKCCRPLCKHRHSEIWIPIGNRIDSAVPCRGFPLFDEPELWLALSFAVLGFDVDEKQPPPIMPKHGGLSDAEVAELLPGEDPTLIGNRLKAAFEAIGFPPCGGCETRKEWLNKAHAYLRTPARQSPKNSAPCSPARPPTTKER